MTGSTIASPPKPAVFLNERFMVIVHGCSVEGRMLWKLCPFIYFLICRGLSNDRVGVCGKGHRFSEDSVGMCWFLNRRFRSRKVGGGYRRTTPIAYFMASLSWTSSTAEMDGDRKRRFGVRLTPCSQRCRTWTGHSAPPSLRSRRGR